MLHSVVNSINYRFKFKGEMRLQIQANLVLRNSIFPFLNRKLFDLRKIYGMNLKTGCLKKMPYVGEFAT